MKRVHGEKYLCTNHEACFFVLSAVVALLLFFFITIFSLENTIRVSNSLDLDQAQHFVGPDLGPSCLQRIQSDDTNRQRVNKWLNGRFTFEKIHNTKEQIYFYERALNHKAKEGMLNHSNE